MSSEPTDYSAFAEAYAARVDSTPHNAFYERPAMLSALPPIHGKRALDAGCGSGWYSEQLIRLGAEVTACDAAASFVSATRARVGGGATVLQHDLRDPLSFAADASFDLVICPLVLHYIEDWGPVLGEVSRVLKMGGHLLFSTHHPTMDWQQFQTDDYFRTELVEDVWDVGTVRFYRRPLTAITGALADAGFVIEQQPTEAFRHADPEWYERLRTRPWFLVVRARKDR